MFPVELPEINLTSLLQKVLHIETKLNEKFNAALNKTHQQNQAIPQNIPSPREIEEALAQGKEAFDAIKSRVSSLIDQSRKGLSDRLTELSNHSTLIAKAVDLGHRITKLQAPMGFIGEPFESRRMVQLLTVYLEVETLDRLVNP